MGYSGLSLPVHREGGGSLFIKAPFRAPLPGRGAIRMRSTVIGAILQEDAVGAAMLGRIEITAKSGEPRKESQ